MIERTRYLIVNADDFGQSAGVNRGVIQAHERGIVTSASLMVRWTAAADAADWAREHPELSLGLHVDLGEWAFRNGGWVAGYQVVPTDDGAKVRAEIRRQLEMFRVVVGGDPTHLDSHQHVHQSEPVRSIMLEVASELGVPLRGCTPGIRHEGGFYGQTGRGEPLPTAITVEALHALILGVALGATEMGCHPGLDVNLDTMYLREREDEVRVLCAPEVRDFLTAEGIELVSFREARIPAR